MVNEVFGRTSIYLRLWILVRARLAPFRIHDCECLQFLVQVDLSELVTRFYYLQSEG